MWLHLMSVLMSSNSTWVQYSFDLFKNKSLPSASLLPIRLHHWLVIFHSFFVLSTGHCKQEWNPIIELHNWWPSTIEVWTQKRPVDERWCCAVSDKECSYQERTFSVGCTKPQLRKFRVLYLLDQWIHHLYVEPCCFSRYCVCIQVL